MGYFDEDDQQDNTDLQEKLDQLKSLTLPKVSGIAPPAPPELTPVAPGVMNSGLFRNLQGITSSKVLGDNAIGDTVPNKTTQDYVLNHGSDDAMDVNKSLGDTRDKSIIQPTPSDKLLELARQYKSDWFPPMIDKNHPGAPTILPSSTPRKELASIGTPVQKDLSEDLEGTDSPEKAGKSERSVDNLKALQEQAENTRNLNKWGKIGDRLAATLGRTAVPGVSQQARYQDIYDQNIKDAGQPVADYQARIAQEQEDPNSTSSVNARAMMAKFMPELADNDSFQSASAADLAKMFPFVSKHLEGTENRASREFIAGENNKTRAANAKEVGLRHQDMLDAKDQAIQDKTENDFGNRLDNVGGRGWPPAAKMASKTLFGAQKLQSMADQFGSLNQMTPELYADFVSAFNNLTTDGQATDAKFKKVLPNNMELTGAKVASWLASAPKGAEQQEYIKLFLDSAQAQAKAAQKEIDKDKKGLFNTYKSKVSPEFWQSKYDEHFPEQGKQTAVGKHAPGSVVSVKGKQYRVGQDGDSLDPL